MTTNEELFVRLKAHDPRRGHVLRCYCVAGVKFHEERGWYRVPVDLGEYLRGVRELAGDATSPLAFDVCSEAEAQALDLREQDEKERRSATHAISAEPRGRSNGEPRKAEPKAEPKDRRPEPKPSEPKKEG